MPRITKGVFISALQPPPTPIDCAHDTAVTRAMQYGFKPNSGKQSHSLVPINEERRHPSRRTTERQKGRERERKTNAVYSQGD